MIRRKVLLCHSWVGGVAHLKIINQIIKPIWARLLHARFRITIRHFVTDRQCLEDTTIPPGCQELPLFVFVVVFVCYHVQNTPLNTISNIRWPLRREDWVEELVWRCWNVSYLPAGSGGDCVGGRSSCRGGCNYAQGWQTDPGRDLASSQSKDLKISDKLRHHSAQRNL